MTRRINLKTGSNWRAEIDFTGRITSGPNSIGFDSWFGDDVPNWPPFAWREDEKIIGPIIDAPKGPSVADIMAVVAEVVGHELPQVSAEDSVSFLPVLHGETPDQPLHETVVCHSSSGYFALSSGKWKILFSRGSGGWSGPKENVLAKQNFPEIQLYDLESDPTRRGQIHGGGLPRPLSQKSARLRCHCSTDQNCAWQGIWKVPL